MNIRLKPILALTSLFFLLTWVVFLPAVSMAGTGRPLSPIFEDDMESGEGNWTHYTVTSGYVDQWHLSSQRNHTSGGSYSWKCGATDQFGNYANLNDAGLVTPTVTLPVGAYQLRLHHWMRAETAWGEQAYDGGVVEISQDGGGSWALLTPVGGYPYTITGGSGSPFTPGTPCYSGDFDWTEAVFDLSGYAGEVKFRFRFGSDSMIGYEGWYIDDITVAAAPPPPTPVPTVPPPPGVIFAENFDGGLPETWTVIDGSGDGYTWTDENPGYRSNPNWDPPFMIADSDWAGFRDMDEQLITPAIDCGRYVNVTLSFSHYFYRYSGEIADVDVRVGSGAWQNVARYSGGSDSGVKTIDISAIADRRGDVQVRWRYHNANYEWYWGIDNVSVSGDLGEPTPTPSATPLPTSTPSPTPFGYRTPSPTATPAHTPPAQPQIEVTPGSLSVAIPSDSITTRNLTISNVGMESLEFSISTRETTAVSFRGLGVVFGSAPAASGPESAAESTSGEGISGSVADFSTLREKLGVYPDLTHPYRENKLLVRFKPGVSSEARVGLLERLEAEIVTEYTLVPGLALLRVSSSVEDGISAFEESGAVYYAEPDYTVSILGYEEGLSTPNDPRFGELWGLHNTGQSGGTPGADISAVDAWGLHRGSRQVVVGVIDTGVDYNHEDLAANMWVNPEDDTHGYNAINDTRNPMDDHNHGTHCAGTIGAVGDNAKGVVGVNWEVSIMGLKFLNSSGSGYVSDAIKCVEFAVDYGADLTSNSWGGGGFSQGLKDAIIASHNAGMLFVAAAGNDYGRNIDVNPTYPASYDVPNVVAVASTTRTDGLSSFSNWGPTKVQFGAPGSDILSTVRNNSYATYSGTSMACPHGAGLAALLHAYSPSLSHLEVKQIMVESADPIPALAGKCVSEGRINAYEALKLAGVEWLEFDTTSGSVAPGSGMTVKVAFDAAGMETGTYGAEIVIASNDPANPEVIVPATLEVLPPITPPPTATPTPSLTPTPTSAPSATPLPPVGNIDPVDKYAWGENIGWVNFRPESGGVTVRDGYLEGWARSANVGWISLKGEGYGVANDGEGNLSGWAWAENAGWIDFAPTVIARSASDEAISPSNVIARSVSDETISPSNVIARSALSAVALAKAESDEAISTPGVKVDASGNFSGFAWSSNVGWIKFASESPVQYRVRTSWRPGGVPTPTPYLIPTPTSVPTRTPQPTPIPTPLPYEDWVAQYPDLGSETGHLDDPDVDGWNNLAEYQFYLMTGRESDPTDPGSGGQAVPLAAGWNLVSITLDKCWYDSARTGGVPDSVAGDFVDVAGSPPAWGDVFESIEGEYGLILSQAGGDSTYNPEIPHISTLDWIAPDRAFWVKMDASGLLVLEGGRVEVLGGKYPPLSLHSGTEYSGWTLLPFLPGTRFYTDGQAKDAPEPSDLTGEAGFPAVSDTLRAGLNMEPVTWDQVERIQVIYPPPIGGTAYQRGLPDGFQSLKFLMPGYGLWLKMDEAYPGGEIIYQEP